MEAKAESPPASMNPNAVAPMDLARLLSRLGGQPVTLAMLEADIAAGAPTNADGTMNVLHYAARLVNFRLRNCFVWRRRHFVGIAKAV